MSEEGDVPELLLLNRGAEPILVNEGEILVGAKQNRVVNITAIVVGYSSVVLPVSCVEQGRWDYVSRHFKAEACATPRLRALKTRSIQASRAVCNSDESDQKEVWGEVDQCLTDLGAASATGSLTDGYRSAKKRLSEYRRHFKLPPRTQGILVCRGNQVLGTDLFDSPKPMRQLWRKLSDAYFLEAARDESKARRTPKKVARSFLSQVASGIRSSEQQVGDGIGLEVDGKQVVGSGVCYRGKMCYLSAFGTE